MQTEASVLMQFPITRVWWILCVTVSAASCFKLSNTLSCFKSHQLQRSPLYYPYRTRVSALWSQSHHVTFSPSKNLCLITAGVVASTLVRHMFSHRQTDASACWSMGCVKLLGKTFRTKFQLVMGPECENKQIASTWCLWEVSTRLKLQVEVVRFYWAEHLRGSRSVFLATPGRFYNVAASLHTE